MIREDRELLAELARLNTDIPSLALRIMDGSASVAEQIQYGERLIAAGERLRCRTPATHGIVVEGEILRTSGAGEEESLALPSHTVEPVVRRRARTQPPEAHWFESTTP